MRARRWIDRPNRLRCREHSHPADTGLHRVRGFTLLELLIVLAITGMLMGILIPSLSAARREAKQTQCLGNLHALSVALGAYAADDRHSQLIPAHPIAGTNPLHDEGYFDYGGNTGASNVWEGRRLGPQSERTAETRPLNAVLFDWAAADDAAFEVFRCPSDEGIPFGTHTGNPMFWDPAMQNQPMFVSVGTSYGANAYRARDDEGGDQQGRFFSIGPFLRSSDAIPHPSIAVILYDAVMWYNTSESSHSGLLGWAGLPGWHQRGPQYNATFADGHAKNVRASAKDLQTGGDPRYERLYLRGRQFRFDSFPAPPIEDAPRAVEDP